MTSFLNLLLYPLVILTALARWVVLGADWLLFFFPEMFPALGVFLGMLFALRAVRNTSLTRWLGRALLGMGFACGACSLAYLMNELTFGGAEYAYLALCLLISSPFCMWLGWLLASGRKSLVLFLRRFGNEPLNDAIRSLVRRKTRGRVRLVTLDDSAFRPAGPRWARLIVALAPSAAALAVAAVVYPQQEREIRAEAMFTTGAVYKAHIVLALASLACIIAFVISASAAFSQFAARARVADARSLARTVARARRLRSLWQAPLITAPMAMVVSATEALWQDSVKSLARACDLTLIDITHPRAHICWELRTLRATAGHIILLAERNKLTTWWDEAALPGHDPTVAELRELALELPLVLYDSPDRLHEAGLTQAATALLTHR
jgi:hypothetical protein